MTYHLLPIKDLKEHEELSTCHCFPKVEFHDGEMLIIHNSFDKREITEHMETKFKVGDPVAFKIDLRGFNADYVIEDISEDGKALLGRDHFWKTDPCIGNWYELDKLRLRQNVNIKK